MIGNTKDTRRLGRLLCLLLAFALLMPSLQGAQAAATYGVVVMDNVLFRKAPNTSDFWARLNTGWVAEILATETHNDVVWYKAKANLPHDLKNTFTGYLRSDVFRQMTPEEQTLWLQNPTQGGFGGVGGGVVPSGTTYAIVTTGGAPLRQTASAASVVITGFLKDTVITVLEVPADKLNGFYKVTGGGFVGYINAAHIHVLGAGGSGGTPSDDSPPDGTPVTQDGYVMITKHNVNLRRTPGGESQLQILIDTILPYFGLPTQALGYTWVYVKHESGVYGYVRSDCYKFVDASGNQVEGPKATAQPSPAPGGQPPAAGSTGYIRLVRGGVNLRKSPGGASFAQLDTGTVLPYYGFAQQGGYTWYYVTSSFGAGYVRSDMAALTSGTAPIPGGSGSTGALGYVITTMSNVNLRQSASNAAPIYQRLDRATVWPLIGPVTRNEGYNWFHVQVDSRQAYLRGDVARQLTDGEVTAYLAGIAPGITPPTGGSPTTTKGYIMTTMNSVNIRQSPSLDATRITQVEKQGTVFSYDGSVNSGGRLWYRLNYNGQVCYMLASLARVLTPEEAARYTGGAPVVTATPAPTAPVDPKDLSSTALTVMDNVLVRLAGSMSGKQISKVYAAGTQVKLLGPTASADGYDWYQVFAGGVNGWMRADMLRVLTKEEEQKLISTGDPDAPKEASYPTLARGSTGEAVTRLQAELSRLGFLPASGVTGTYTTDTVDAVRAYQLAAGLFVDGIAGPNTQHKLYGTVPVGTYTPPTGGANLYPVEKLDWSVAQNVWQKDAVATITDVKTGLSFQAKRWSGLHHADCEPLTSADTAIYCRIYGVRNAQEIAEKNLWQRRALWVTVAGRTLAASIYGVPHNYPAGDTIPGNDFNGQFCVHFVNSRTHSTQNIDPNHMAMIDEAYRLAPSRK